MPKVHEQEGCLFYIYVNDHEPKHVYVRIGGKLVALYLDEEASVKKNLFHVKSGDLRKAQRIVRENLGKLLSAWERIHGR